MRVNRSEIKLYQFNTSAFSIIERTTARVRAWTTSETRMMIRSSAYTMFRFYRRFEECNHFEIQFIDAKPFIILIFCCLQQHLLQSKLDCVQKIWGRGAALTSLKNSNEKLTYKTVVLLIALRFVWEMCVCIFGGREKQRLQCFPFVECTFYRWSKRARGSVLKSKHG